MKFGLSEDFSATRVLLVHEGWEALANLDDLVLQILGSLGPRITTKRLEQTPYVYRLLFNDVTALPSKGFQRGVNWKSPPESALGGVVHES